MHPHRLHPTPLHSHARQSIPPPFPLLPTPLHPQPLPPMCKVYSPCPGRLGTWLHGKAGKTAGDPQALLGGGAPLRGAPGGPLPNGSVVLPRAGFAQNVAVKWGRRGV